MFYKFYHRLKNDQSGQGLLFTAFFDAVHTALLSVNRYRMKSLAETGRTDAKAVVGDLVKQLSGSAG